MRGFQATCPSRHLLFTDETDVFAPKYHSLIGCVAFDVNNNNTGSVFY